MLQPVTGGPQDPIGETALRTGPVAGTANRGCEVPMAGDRMQPDPGIGRGGMPGVIGVGMFGGCRTTPFDQDVLMARYIRQVRQDVVGDLEAAKLLDRAESSARGSGRVDQMLWLANAYKGEFSFVIGASTRSLFLERDAWNLISSGRGTVGPMMYPGLDYGGLPGGAGPAPQDDPFGPATPPVDYERQTRHARTFMDYLNKH